MTYKLFSLSYEGMNLLKKMLASITTTAVLFSTLLIGTPAGFAGTPQFTDISGHWAESYIVDLAEQNIISTEGKTMFYPNNSLTRAELTKLAIEAFYGDSVEDLATAFADKTKPSFSDVPATEWFFNYVEIAKGLDIVQGFPDGTFAPNAPITRSAALKVILLTGDIATMLEPAPPFTDVPTGDWSYEYVATAFNHCIVNGTTPTTFTPNGNVTRAESTKILANSIKVANGEDICTETPTPSGSPSASGSPTASPSGSPTGVSDAVLEVSLSSQNPEGVSVPKNGSNVPFLALDLTNKGDEDVEVTAITVSHGGLGDEDEVSDVKVFDGIKQHGSDRPFTNDEQIAPLNLASDPVVVTPGTTKTIVIAGDLSAAASGGEHSFIIVDPTDITAVGSDTGGAVEVTGDFALTGETMTVSNVSVGSLGFTFKSVADTSVEVGETDVELARLEVTAGAAEDVLLKALTLEINGIDDGDIGNIYVEYQGERISNIIELLSNETATLDFTENENEGWILEDGDNRTIRVKGDILGGVDDTATPQFDEVASDVIASGLTYGFGVALTSTNNTSTITINGGDITFAFDSSSRDVAPDTDNVEFGILTISNMGEAVELKEGLILYGINNANATGSVTDLKLVNVETGSTFMGPEDVAALGSNVDGVVGNDFGVAFSDEVILETGEKLTLSLQGDIPSTAANDQKFSFGLDIPSVSVEGIESNKTTASFDIKPSGDPQTKVYTIAEPSLTITAKTLGNDTVVADAASVTVWQGTVSANEVEDLYIRQLVFLDTGTATDDDVDDYSIFKKEGNVLTPVETGADPTATADVTFSNLDEDGGTNGILVPAGDEFTLVVTANISSNPAASTIILALDADPITTVDVEDEDGDTATLTNAASNIASGGTITITSSGTFAASVDNNKTDSQIVPAGLEDVPVGVFKFEATNESAEVKKLAVKINEVDTATTFDVGAPALTQDDTTNDSDAIDSVALFYYDDGTAVKKTNGQAATVSSIDANNIALFQDLDLIATDSEDQLIEVRVNIREMDDQDSNALARSGHAFNSELVFNTSSEVRGVDSGEILTNVSTGFAGTATNDEAVGANVVVEVTGFAAGEFVVGDYVIISAGLATEEVAQVEAVVDTVSITVDLTQDPLVGATITNLNTAPSDTLYVFNNKVIVEKSASQPSGTLTDGTNKELLKFDVDFTGDTSDEPFLYNVNVKIEGTNACVAAAFASPCVDANAVVYLYNGDNELIATDVQSAAGDEDFVLTVGTDTAVIGGLSTDIDLTAGSENIPGDPVAANGETYTIKADIVTNTGAEGDAISATIDINGSAAGNDDIIWIDGGSTGSDGIAVKWIDLGPSSSITQIQNTLSN